MVGSASSSFALDQTGSCCLAFDRRPADSVHKLAGSVRRPADSAHRLADSGFPEIPFGCCSGSSGNPCTAAVGAGAAASGSSCAGTSP